MNLRSRLTLIGVGLTAIFHSSVLFGQGLRFDPPAPNDFQVAIAKMPEDDRKAIAKAAGDVFPVFVFIPGIMGSKITKLLSDGRSKVIWGEVTGGIFSRPDADLAYDENDKVKVNVLNEFYVYRKSFDVYGEAIQTIKYLDITGDNIRLFAYDWRQSNVKSAQDFSQWLCANKSAIGDRPVVFMAHSMGGLILKYWLKHTFDVDGCGGEDGKFAKWVHVKKIIFLGTPHYGAPKAITAFADQYYLMVDPDTLAGKLFGDLDANTLSSGINKYGATFPSAYELLSIVNTSTCFNNADWPHPIEVRQPDGSVHSHIDLFSPNTWALFQWPKQLSVPRDKFM